MVTLRRDNQTIPPLKDGEVLIYCDGPAEMKTVYLLCLKGCCNRPFVPYTLRHTALTRLAEKAGGNVFVLAAIAGHSTIAVTQRYVHPQADAMLRVFVGFQQEVGTKMGTSHKPGISKGAENHDLNTEQAIESK